MTTLALIALVILAFIIGYYWRSICDRVDWYDLRLWLQRR